MAGRRPGPARLPWGSGAAARSAARRCVSDKARPDQPTPLASLRALRAHVKQWANPDRLASLAFLRGGPTETEKPSRGQAVSIQISPREDRWPRPRDPSFRDYLDAATQQCGKELRVEVSPPPSLPWSPPSKVGCFPLPLPRSPRARFPSLREHYLNEAGVVAGNRPRLAAVGARSGGRGVAAALASGCHRATTTRPPGRQAAEVRQRPFQTVGRPRARPRGREAASLPR